MSFAAILLITVVLIGVVIGLKYALSSNPSECVCMLRIRLTEDADAMALLASAFGRYTCSVKLVRVRSLDHGSVRELTYVLKLPTPDIPKDLIAALMDTKRILSLRCFCPQDSDPGEGDASGSL